MILVILQHSYLLVDLTLIPSVLNFCIWHVTFMAAVAFVSVSGTIYSYSLKLRTDWRSTHRRYVSRALLLILVAHPVINIATYPYSITGNNTIDNSLSYFLRHVLFGFPITDTIAVCMLVSPFFINNLSPLRRVVLILTILAVTPIVVSLLVPVEPWLIILKECMFGKLGEPKLFWFPLLPWLAIFLSGSFVGEGIARFRQSRITAMNLAQQMNRAGIKLFACSIVLIIGYKLMKLFFQASLSSDFFRAIYPAQTTGLLPAYFAFLVFVLAALIYIIDISGGYNRLFWFLSVFGRASLFTFIIQFVVVESIPAILGFKGVLGLPGFFVLFVAGTVVSWLFSYFYGRVMGQFSVDDYSLHLQVVSQSKCVM